MPVSRFIQIKLANKTNSIAMKSNQNYTQSHFFFACHSPMTHSSISVFFVFSSVLPCPREGGYLLLVGFATRISYVIYWIYQRYRTEANDSQTTPPPSPTSSNVKSIKNGHYANRNGLLNWKKINLHLSMVTLIIILTK